MSVEPDGTPAPKDEEPARIENGADSAAGGTPPPRSETVGTGSAIGIGCLVLMVLLIIAAVAFRWGGVSW
ncbi:MAG: hypothetical protein IT338_02405 [Thermomicrobiales bacterium]|nr:hypothetical protein [Thermomicrobiales bacterium]